ncbi:hypothetical protein ACET77_13010 [Aeromonas allosaccharophila]|uniref:hypothetical protein n=1 Tax=Aeromonas allosaccharophila TaxID=656 RepID=UPI0038D16DBC
MPKIGFEEVSAPAISSNENIVQAVLTTAPSQLITVELLSYNMVSCGGIIFFVSDLLYGKLDIND